MIHALIFVALAQSALAARLPPIDNCGSILYQAKRAMEAIPTLEKLDGERGVARLMWSEHVISGEDLEAIHESARAENVALETEGVHAFLGTAVGFFQARGTARQVAMLLKDLLVMKGRELALAQWLPDVFEPKDDLWSEEEFRKKLNGKAQAEFPYAYESDEYSDVRTLAIMRIWPATFFSPRIVYMRLEREMDFPLLKAKTFKDAYQEWQGAPAIFELDGEVYVFGEHDFLWDLRELRKTDLAKWKIDLRVDPRPYLE